MKTLFGVIFEEVKKNIKRHYDFYKEIDELDALISAKQAVFDFHHSLDEVKRYSDSDRYLEWRMEDEAIIDELLALKRARERKLEAYSRGE